MSHELIHSELKWSIFSIAQESIAVDLSFYSVLSYPTIRPNKYVPTLKLNLCVTLRGVVYISSKFVCFDLTVQPVSFNAIIEIMVSHTHR